MKLAKIGTAFDRLLGVLAFLSGALIVAMVLYTTLHVVLRYFFRSPLNWIYETSQISLLYINFLAAAWVLRKEGHVKMDLIVCRLKPGTQNIINIVTSLLGFGICLIITRYAVQVTWSYIISGRAIPSLLNIPEWIYLIIIPIGFTLLTIQFARRCYGFIKQRKLTDIEGTECEGRHEAVEIIEELEELDESVRG